MGRPSPDASSPWSWRFPVAAFAAVTVVVWAVGQLTIRVAPAAPAPHRWPDHRWLDTFARWDTGWYFHIAESGYFYDGPGVQSAVAFFPGYPLLMRLAGVVTGDLIVAGVVVTLVSGLVATVLFHGWARDAFDQRTARLAVILLLVSPFAYFLLGAVFSDAMFLAATLAAFVALERRHPYLAAAAGAVATATRPVGLAVVLALVLRSMELDGVLPGSRGRLCGGERPAGSIPLLPRAVRLERLRPTTAVVALSVLGLVGFCALLWWRFGEPLAFAHVETAAGWNRTVDADAVFKLDFFRRWRDFSPGVAHFGLTLQAVLSVILLGLVVPTVRRLGWAYGTYVLVVVGVPLLTSSDFIAMGRYVLVAFPALAVAAALLLERPRSLAVATVFTSSALLVVMTVVFARWVLL